MLETLFFMILGIIGFCAVIFLKKFYSGSSGGGSGYGVGSKRCERCGKTVPIYMQVGDKCPHCGVVWGKEIQIIE